MERASSCPANSKCRRNPLANILTHYERRLPFLCTDDDSLTGLYVCLPFVSTHTGRGRTDVQEDFMR